MRMRAFYRPPHTLALAAILPLLAGLPLQGGCGEERSAITSGTYHPVRICYGTSCREDLAEVGIQTLTMTIRKSEGRVEFQLPSGQQVSAGFTVAPREDWPEDCYTASDGKTAMETLRLDTPLDIDTLHFEHPVLVRYCGVPDPVYVSLFDAQGPPYPWSCSSGESCVEFLSDS